MRAHTLGPWFVDRDHAGKIMGVASPKRRHDLEFVAECQDEANARLIAAAPDLLEFAEWAIGQLCGDSGTGESYWEQFQEFRKGKSAIAKAEGRA